MTAGTLSYATSALAYLALALVLAIGWRGRAAGMLLLIAAAASFSWSALAVAALITPWIPPAAVAAGEVLRDAAWLLFLWWLLWGVLGYRNRMSVGFAVVAGTVVLIQLAATVAVGAGIAITTSGVTLLVAGRLALALFGLMLVEHVFRLTEPQNRWSIKYLCLGLGALFAFDFYLYADALLFLRIAPAIWDARGFINALIVPLIAVSAARNPSWSLDVYVSRGVVFHTTALVGAGAYLVLMAAAGYYLRAVGGEWGVVLQTTFFVAAIILLSAVLFSGHLRARLRVFISKHFFNYQFDYREEWLRFTHTLSAAGAGASLAERITAALSGIVGSPGGSLWAREGNGYHPQSPRHVDTGLLRADDPLCAFLERTGWVVILDEYRTHPEPYGDLQLPAALAGDERAWIIVPLLHEQTLQGFVVLERPGAAISVDWEVRDLLRTAGRQAASHLAQMEAVQALTLARQFESFNRLSAYVIHDLKNLIAQLSLVVSNARRHGHNEDFLRDAIETVDNAVARMNRLMQQLRSGDMSGRIEPVSTANVAFEVLNGFGDRQPAVGINVKTDEMQVLADPDRLRAVLGHLVQNALDATPRDGHVQVVVHGDGEYALIDVEDSGCGMDAGFIRERLFRPFDTTKGMSGMGIGAYESREYLRTLGGDLEVWSEPQKGSRFRMRIPRARRETIGQGVA